MNSTRGNEGACPLVQEPVREFLIVNCELLMEFTPFGQIFSPPAAEEQNPRRRRLYNCPKDTASVNN